MRLWVRTYSLVSAWACWLLYSSVSLEMHTCHVFVSVSHLHPDLVKSREAAFGLLHILPGSYWHISAFSVLPPQQQTFPVSFSNSSPPVGTEGLMLIIWLLDPLLWTHMVSLGWIRIINRALLPVKNEFDTSIVLHYRVVSEMSWTVCLEESTRLFPDFPESSGDILCNLCLGPWGHGMNTVHGVIWPTHCLFYFMPYAFYLAPIARSLYHVCPVLMSLHSVSISRQSQRQIDPHCICFTYE